MYRKIIGFFIFIILLIPVLSSTVIASQEPILEIGKIHGRSTFLLGPIVIIEIKNTGDADAYNVTWSFGIKHPIFKILNFTGDFTIDIIKAGDTVIKTAGLSWIGRFEITVTACIPDGNLVSKTVKGFSFFYFILIFPD